MSSKKYLLYIDILGFAELAINNSHAVKELYAIINDLNVHRHDAFHTIVFSDTILVTNKHELTDEHSHRYHVMFCCEFARDLLHYLHRKGSRVQFRAILTYGEFEYYRLSNMECYYGKALVHTYRKEKEVNAVGLFIDQKLLKYNEVFPTTHYDADLHFVFLTNYFRSLQFYTGGQLPLSREIIEPTEEFDGLPADLDIIRYYFEQAREHAVPRVRAKYQQTAQFYRNHYPRLIAQLEAAGFDISVINNEVNWKRKRMPFFGHDA